MANPLVAIVMGSDSDLEIMREAAKALDSFGSPYEMDVTSAHRSPARTAEASVLLAGTGLANVAAADRPITSGSMVGSGTSQ